MKIPPKAYLIGHQVGRWFGMNVFWIGAVTFSAFAFLAVTSDNLLAALALVSLVAVFLAVGVYDANVRFTKTVLTEYDRILQSQMNRKGFKVIKGGKKL